MRKSERGRLTENWLHGGGLRRHVRTHSAPLVVGRKRDDHIAECHTNALALVTKIALSLLSIYSDKQCRTA